VFRGQHTPTAHFGRWSFVRVKVSNHISTHTTPHLAKGELKQVTGLK